MNSPEDNNPETELGPAGREACSNVISTIDVNRAFPTNVFRTGWTEFFFFDSDGIFDRAFVRIAKILLEIERARCACIRNLDTSLTGKASGQSSFVISKQLSEETYADFLRGSRPGDGWIYWVDRFGCTSDLNQWCIYCERAQEIGVMGLRGNHSLTNYSAVIAELGALPIKEAIARPLSHGFSATALSAVWREELLRHYSVSR